MYVKLIGNLLIDLLFLIYLHVTVIDYLLYPFLIQVSASLVMLSRFVMAHLLMLCLFGASSIFVGFIGLDLSICGYRMIGAIGILLASLFDLGISFNTSKSTVSHSPQTSPTI